MDEKLIENVSNKIYRRFPAVRGVKPRIQAQSSSLKRTYTLAYHNKVELSDRKSMPYWVRVVVDEHGKILKTTVSH